MKNIIAIVVLAVMADATFHKLRHKFKHADTPQLEESHAYDIFPHLFGNRAWHQPAHQQVSTAPSFESLPDSKGNWVCRNSNGGTTIIVVPNGEWPVPKSNLYPQPQNVGHTHTSESPESAIARTHGGQGMIDIRFG